MRGLVVRSLVLRGLVVRSLVVRGLVVRSLVLPVFCLGVVRRWFVGVRQGCLGAWWAVVGLGSAFLVAVWRWWVLECVVFVMG